MLFFLLSPSSEGNQIVFTQIKEILRKEHGGENCPWTELQMEGLYIILFCSKLIER